MKWTLVRTRPALEDTKKLEPVPARRVREAMIDLAGSGHGDVVKLKNVRPSEWRSRAGDRRAFYRFRNDTNEIHVLRVRRRDEAYPGGS